MSFAVLAGSAFPRGGGFLEGKLVLARKSNEHAPASRVPRSSWLSAVESLLELPLPSKMQSTEWRVRAIKGPFSRLWTTLLVKSLVRFIILSLAAHPYDFRVGYVALNHMRSVYIEHNPEIYPWVKH